MGSFRLITKSFAFALVLLTSSLGASSALEVPKDPAEARRVLEQATAILNTPELRRDPAVREAMQDLERAMESAQAASAIYQGGPGNTGSSFGRGLFGHPFFADPWDPISGLQSMRAMKQQMLQGMNQPASPRGGFTGTGPSVTMREEADSYIITANVPGVEEGKLNIEMTDNSVRISGTQRRTEETREADGSVSRSESYSSFSNRVALPGRAQTDKATTTREGDVVTITIPKASDGAQATVIQK